MTCKCWSCHDTIATGRDFKHSCSNWRTTKGLYLTAELNLWQMKCGILQETYIAQVTKFLWSWWTMQGVQNIINIMQSGSICPHIGCHGFTSSPQLWLLKHHASPLSSLSCPSELRGKFYWTGFKQVLLLTLVWVTYIHWSTVCLCKHLGNFSAGK